MTIALESRGYPAAFSHPVVGRSELDAARVAVRWHPDASTAARDALLDELGLVPATPDEQPRRLVLAVAGTDGLWWVQRADGDVVDADLLGRLEDSGLVEWAAPGYRATGRGSVFTVNPTRLYLDQYALDTIGEASARAAGVAPDAQRTSRVPGLVALRVVGRTAIEAARGLTATLSGRGGRPALVFESIPFSPPARAVRPAAPAQPPHFWERDIA
jgi:hypothetical protein